MPASETVIVIPAFNEEEWIGRTIDLVRATKVPAKIIVVNDGSTDRTAEIAFSKGCSVITISHRGKASAFFAGIKAALELNPKAVVTIDADMTEVPGRGLRELVKGARKATERGETRMIVAPYAEGLCTKMVSATYQSGIRAFSVPALYRIRASKIKKHVQGFGLEIFLNYFLGERKKESKRVFRQREAFRGDPLMRPFQLREVEEMAQKRKLVLKHRVR